VPGLDDYGALLQSGTQAFQNPIAFQVGLQSERLNQQIAQAKLADYATKQQRAEEFKRDLTAAMSNPHAGNISALIMKYPEFADEIKSGWDVRDKAANQADLTQLGEMYSAAASGRWDLASKAAHARYDADKAAGQTDPADDEIIRAIDAAAAGDETQRKAVLGMIGIQLAAKTGPEHFGTVYGSLKGGYTLEAGATRYDDNGNIVAQSPFLKTEGGGILERDTGDLGGGPHPMDEGKPAEMSAWLQNLPAPIAPVAQTLAQGGLPAPVVSGFLGNFHAEGGYGGAQGDGGTASGIGQWRGERAANFERVMGKPISEASPAEQGQFVLWEMQHPEQAGMTVEQRDAILSAQNPAQAAALIDQFYERSDGSARTKRQAAAAAFANGSPPSGIASTYRQSSDTPAPPGYHWAVPPKGREAPAGYRWNGDNLEKIPGGPADTPKLKKTRMTPAEVAAEGLDPNIVYYRGEDGVPVAVSGQDTRTKGALKAWPPQALNARSSNEAQVTNIDRALNLLDPANNTPAAKAARGAIGPGTGMLGDTFTQFHDPKGADFRALIGQLGGVIIKDISGAAVSAAEDDRLKKWIPLVTDRPEVAARKLRNLRNEIVQRNSAMDEAYSEDQGYRPFRGGSQAPVRVRSVQEAKKLPSGTLFVTPDGRVMRKR